MRIFWHPCGRCREVKRRVQRAELPAAAPRGMLARPDILSGYKFGNARGRAWLAGGYRAGRFVA